MEHNYQPTNSELKSRDIDGEHYLSSQSSCYDCIHRKDCRIRDFVRSLEENDEIEVLITKCKRKVRQEGNKVFEFGRYIND